jgi:hypothetical protein
MYRRNAGSIYNDKFMEFTDTRKVSRIVVNYYDSALPSLKYAPKECAMI